MFIPSPATGATAAARCRTRLWPLIGLLQAFHTEAVGCRWAEGLGESSVRGRKATENVTPRSKRSKVLKTPQEAKYLKKLSAKPEQQKPSQKTSRQPVDNTQTVPVEAQNGRKHRLMRAEEGQAVGRGRDEGTLC